MSKVFIIAEAGVNHNGSLVMALHLVDKAVEIGADCVKFQTFKAEQIVTAASPKANYQMQVTDKNESQFDMLKKLELNKDAFAEIKKYCDKKGIRFLSTPYNPEDADLLNSIGVDGFKIASGQLVETWFLKYVAKFGKQMIISTGMANMDEVRAAVEAIRSTGNNDLVVLQCNTDYPSKIEDTNIRAMLTMRDELKVRVGYSDHVPNNYACFAAVALGAEVIEKHFTLDKTLPGPDHSSSLEPSEFKELINGVRNIEKCMGTGVKVPSEAEVKNTFGMRRSLVARTDLAKGTILKAEHIGFKRPANGLSPKLFEVVLGKELLTDMKKDEAFTNESVKL
ncbi:MAG TPA: N-acetylneuraminate synthase [Bacteroidia bacterium]|jgi:N-acetylneuraminate synthase/N,N'-diacetyllegionaminate synthase|nr:N-acetylneuraminate synthase [Bacteroidia bacterium]